MTIARVSRLPQIGKIWFERRVLMKPLGDEFLEPSEVVQGTKKGTRRVSLWSPWGEVALCVLKFITCEG